MSSRRIGGILKKINCMSDEITDKFAIGSSLRRLSQKISDQAKLTAVDILNKLTAKLVHAEKALVKTLISEEDRTKKLKAEEGFVGTLISEEDRTKKLKAEEGSIKELVSENNKMKKLDVKRANIAQLESDGAYMKRLATPYAITDELNAANVNIYKKLTAKDTEVGDLKAEKIEAEEITSNGNLTAGETTVNDSLTITAYEPLDSVTKKGAGITGGLTISTTYEDGKDGNGNIHTSEFTETLTARQLRLLNQLTNPHIQALNKLLQNDYTFDSLTINNKLTVNGDIDVKKNLTIDGIPVKKIFIGTKAQWDALSESDKKKYDMAAIDDL